MYEIALNFQDPVHNGDRRKKSQQCYSTNWYDLFFHNLGIKSGDILTIIPYNSKSNSNHTSGMAGTSPGHATVAFVKSKSLLGSINNIERARVGELVNPDVDSSIAPHFRAIWLQLRCILQSFQRCFSITVEFLSKRRSI